MQILVITPEYIIPWEQPCETGAFGRKALEEKERRRSIDEILREAVAVPFRSYTPSLPKESKKGWSDVPLIPVFDAPCDLLHLGFFIIYNGNRRHLAAKEAGIALPCLLLETGEDLSALQRYRREECKRVLDGLTLEETRRIIWDNARRYINHEMVLPL